MKNWLNKNLNTIIVGSFLIPILLVAFVSISHVTTFYNLANPISWATYLSVAVEIAALAALAGVSAKFGKFIYIPFGIVTFIQLLGNFFFSYSWINIDSKEFKDWMSMVGPILEPLGVDSENPSGHRTLLAFFTGGLLPFISLTFAHMLIVYSNKIKTENVELPEKNNDNLVDNELPKEEDNNNNLVDNELPKEEDNNNNLVDNELPTEDNNNNLVDNELPTEDNNNNLVDTELSEEVIDKISREVGKFESELDKQHKPYNPSDEDLKKLKALFEKYTTQVPTTPEPTPEPIYFVDDEPIVENNEGINRLVYTKDE